jgi:O-antigen ligase
MLLFGTLVALEAILQTFTGDGQIFWLFRVPYSDVALGPILSRNHFAAFLEILLPLALYRAFRSDKNRLLYEVAAACLYAAAIVSSSRAGTVLCTVLLVVVPALMYLRGKVEGRHAGTALVRIFALLALFTVVVGWQTVWNRLVAPDPMAYRDELDISSLHMIAAHPWLGTGLGTWPVAYPKYAIVDAGTFTNQAHCDWLQWAAEGGIPLGMLLVFLFPWALRRSLSNIWGLGVCAVLLHACVDYPFSRPALGSWFIVMLAMLAASDGASKAEAGSAPGEHADSRREDSSVRMAGHSSTWPARK